MLRSLNSVNNNLIIFVLVIVGVVIGYQWHLKKKEASHDYFYYLFSKKIDVMVHHVRDTINGRDEQKLIFILYTSLEDFFLEYMKSDALRVKRPKREFYRAYELGFFQTMSSVKMEWTIKSVDRSLVYLFLEKNQNIILNHLKSIERIFLNKSIRRKERRELVAKEHINFLKITSEKYIEAYEEYQKALEGNTTIHEILSRLNIKEEEADVLFERIIADHEKRCEGREILIENQKTIKQLGR